MESSRSAVGNHGFSAQALRLRVFSLCYLSLFTGCLFPLKFLQTISDLPLKKRFDQPTSFSLVGHVLQ